MSDERLTDLEIKFSFAQDLMEELNKIVYRQQQMIDGLQQEIRVLRQQIQTSQFTPEGNTLRDELPPHY